MTEIIRNVRVVKTGTKTLLSFLIVTLWCTSPVESGKLRRRHELLQFGSKCSIPRQGGELSIVTECDASKGLVCDGRACVCDLADSFAYDPISDECRKKLGKSCRLTNDGYEHRELPFHLKCQSSAQCAKISRSYTLDANLESYWRKEDVKTEESVPRSEINMCICKYGYEPDSKLHGCRSPLPNIDFSPFRNESDEEEEEED